MKAIIALEKITREYQLGASTIRALRGVDLTLEKGSYVSIVGPSGSGKSSLLHIIGCMDQPTGGEAWFKGQDVASFSDRQLTQLRASEIGFIFQAFHLNPVLSVLDNVAIALRFIGVDRRESRRRAAVWLEHVGLSHRLGHKTTELSGGERQRVAVARAVVKNPSVILADEPTGNLDTTTGNDIIGLLKDINREKRTTIIQVTHDMNVAAQADQIITLCDGRIASVSPVLS